MNRVTLVGNLGNIPEANHTTSGKKVVNFTMATNKNYLNNSGEKVTDTEWHNVVVWGKLADVVEQHFEKGKKYLVEGEIKTETYEKNGEKKYSTKIVMNNFEFL